MRHVAEGTRVKKPFKPGPRNKKPTDWRTTVRMALRKKQGNFNPKSPWRNNQDGFMVTGRNNRPTENQLDSLEKQKKRKRE